MISDVLRVSYDKNPNDISYICIGREINTEIDMINEIAGDEADELYNILTGRSDEIFCSAEVAREMIQKGTTHKAYVQWNKIVNEIMKRIDENYYNALFKGIIYDSNKRKLESLGYKVYSGSQYNEDYYNVSWKEA